MSVGRTAAELGLLAVLLSCHAPAEPTADTVVEVADGEVRLVGSSFPVGQGPASAAVVDLDGDGHLDLVVANERDGDLSVLLGDGRGGLRPLARVPAGENPNDVAAADLDGDGRIDLAVANHETDYLTLLRGDGEGGFEPSPRSPLTLDVAPHPHAVRAADLDRDGRIDLLVDHREGEGVLVLLGDGEGGFASPGRLVPVGGDPYLGMALGDLDGDGRLDLVTPNPRQVGVLLQSAGEALAFTRAPSVPAPAPFAVGLTDLDGDGRLDLVAASDESSPLVQLFTGDGSGGFSERRDSPLRFAPGAKWIATGDFDGDGLGDAAVASFVEPEVLLVLGGGDSLRTARLPGGENPWGLAAGDFDEDGSDDLVVLDAGGSRGSLYLGEGAP